MDPLNLTLTIPDITNITSFTSFWDNSTFGLFSQLLPLLAVLSVFLATRNIGLTIIVLVIVSVATGGTSLAVLGGGLGLGYLLYKALWSRS